MRMICLILRSVIFADCGEFTPREVFVLISCVANASHHYKREVVVEQFIQLK